MLWASFYWFTNGISYTVKLNKKAFNKINGRSNLILTLIRVMVKESNGRIYYGCSIFIRYIKLRFLIFNVKRGRIYYEKINLQDHFLKSESGVRGAKVVNGGSFRDSKHVNQNGG